MAIANFDCWGSSKTSLFVVETQETTIKNKKIEKYLKIFIGTYLKDKNTNKILKINELKYKCYSAANLKKALFHR
jgi:hypothetical protein